MSRTRTSVLSLFAASIGAFAPFAVVAAVFAAAFAAACGSSDTTATLVPITGITVRAENLTANLGCGLGDSQVFKYAVIVFGRNPNAFNTFDVYVASNVYDCFSDGQFVDLPPSAGVTDYQLQIFAYSSASYQAAGGDAGVRAAAANPVTLPATHPTYTTKCTATEVGDVQALAACDPLSLGASAVTLDAGSAAATVTLSAAHFARGDAGTASCDGEYATVRYRATPSGGTPGAITDVRCSHVTANGVEPVTIMISPAVAPAAYSIEIALLRADGSALGQTMCSAQTSPGLTSSAVCQPLP